jgi:hypothetical protein
MLTYAQVLSLVKEICTTLCNNKVHSLPPALENYFFGLLSKGVRGISVTYIRY